MSDAKEMAAQRQQVIAESTNRWFLETKEMIREMSRKFGWDYVIVKAKDKETGEEYIAIRTFKILDDPLVNQYGIISLIQALEKIVNKNTFLSKIDQRESMVILTDHMISVMDDLAMNIEYYGIDSIATAEKIRSTIETMSELAIYRGRGGVTMEFIKTVQKTLERIVTGEPERKKKGFLQRG